LQNSMWQHSTGHRMPEGLDYWVNESFGGNPTIEQIAKSFFDQPETQALYPAGTTDEEFVTAIYQNLFNRNRMRKAWPTGLEKGASAAAWTVRS
jgi:hypothetical protein